MNKSKINIRPEYICWNLSGKNKMIVIIIGRFKLECFFLLLFWYCSYCLVTVLSASISVYHWKINFPLHSIYWGCRVNACCQFNCRSILSNQKYIVYAMAVWAIIRAYDINAYSHGTALHCTIVFLLCLVVDFRSWRHIDGMPMHHIRWMDFEW